MTRDRPGGRLDVAFTNDAWFPDEPNPDRRDRNLIVQAIEVEGPLIGRGFALPESHKTDPLPATRPGPSRAKPPAPFSPDSPPGRSAARRRLTEVARLVGLVESVLADGESFEQGIRLAVEAVLVSPHFLFRVELDERPGAPRESDRPRAGVPALVLSSGAACPTTPCSTLPWPGGSTTRR